MDYVKYREGGNLIFIQINRLSPNMLMSKILYLLLKHMNYNWRKGFERR